MTKITKAPKRELFRTAPERGLPATARVDREKRIIYGARAMQLGKLSEGDSRPWKVDRVTLEQLVELTAGREIGVKMRFSHPNASRDGLGRHVGRARNARLVDEGGMLHVAVDTHLNAKGGPRTQEQVEHLLDLAEEAPEDFGLSIACCIDGDAMDRQDPDKDGLKAIRLKTLDAIDFVDEPAATSGLFSPESVDIQDLPAQATELLDAYFAEAPADVIRARFGEFLERYLTSRGDESMASKPKNDKAPESAAAEKQELSVEEDVASLKAEIEALKAEIASMKDGESEGEGEAMAEGDPPKESPAAQCAKQQQAAELARRKEIAALCKLAKVPDADRDSMLDAGFSRADAQEWIRAAGYLSKANPAVDDNAADPAGKKPTREEQFGKEYDEHREALEHIGVTRDEFIKSRLKDAA